MLILGRKEGDSILIEGGIHVSNPPEDGPRAILRIATPEATVAIFG